jgi:hypothetical protein
VRWNGKERRSPVLAAPGGLEQAVGDGVLQIRGFTADLGPVIKRPSYGDRN